MFSSNESDIEVRLLCILCKGQLQFLCFLQKPMECHILEIIKNEFMSGKSFDFKALFKAYHVCFETFFSDFVFLNFYCIWHLKASKQSNSYYSTYVFPVIAGEFWRILSWTADGILDINMLCFTFMAGLKKIELVTFLFQYITSQYCW